MPPTIADYCLAVTEPHTIERSRSWKIVYRRLVHRGKLPCKATTAVAGELAGFIWSALVEYEARKKRKVKRKVA